jgi:WhiB family redox-sensing transcriptional regulator
MVVEPHVGGLDWQRQRRCDEKTAEVFFPERGGSSRAAKKVCHGNANLALGPIHPPCAVRAQCLRYAVGNHEEFGIWGGVGVRELRKLKSFLHLSDAELLAMTALPVVAVPVLAPLKSRARRRTMSSDGMKVCRLCEVPKVLDDFCRDKASPDGREARCKECRHKARVVRKARPQQLLATKVCGDCHLPKPLDEYERHDSGVRSYCKPCGVARRRAAWERLSAKARARRLAARRASKRRSKARRRVPMVVADLNIWASRRAS